MKRVLILLSVLLVGLFVNAQSPYTGLTGYAVKQSLGSDSAIVQSKGAFSGRMVIYNFADTTAANTQRIKNYPGALIFTTDSSKLWLRNKYASAWGGIASSSGTTITSIDIFSDSAWVICYSDGSCDTIDVNNDVFVTISNVFGGCNNLLSGGVVTANNPTVTLVFDVTAADYTIGCKPYHTDVSQVTLANGDATFDRFDLVIVDTNEVVSVIQGTPSADPQVPQIDHSSQLVLTTFLVPAGATTADDLGITIEVVYDENLQVAGGEWDSSGVAWTRDFANTSFPAHLAKDLLLSGGTTSTSQIKWTTTDTMRNGQFDVFKFYIRLTDVWVAGLGLDIAFYHGTTKVTNSVIFSNNSYGFDQTVTGSYQIIAIPMANWVFTDSIFFSVVFKPLATPFVAQAFRIDWVQLQGGINQAIGGSSGLYIWNQYSVPQPANWWVAGNARLEGNFQSPQRIGINGTTFYSGSLKAGWQAIANGVEATVYGEYARGNAGGAISIGSQANGSGISIGQYSTTSAVNDINIGGQAVTGTGNVQVGINAAIVGNDNVKIGESGTVTGIRNVNIGYNIGHSFDNTISLGYQASPTQANQFIIPSTITNVRWGAFGDGLITGTPTYLAAWDADGNFIEYPPGGISGGLLIDADNGLSVRSATTAVLGQNEAEVGNPAILLNNREIPMGGFYLTLNASATQAVNIFQTKNAAAAVRARITSAASFSNTGGQSGSEIFGDGASVGSTSSVAIGNTASAPGATSIAIGNAANSGNAGGNIAIGSSVIAGNFTGITVVGTSAVVASGNTTLVGSGATATARGTGLGTSVSIGGINSTALGEQAVTASGNQYSIALGFGATTTAANQFVVGASGGGAEGANHYFLGNGVIKASGGVIADIDIQPTGQFGTDQAGVDFYINGAKRTGNSTTGGLLIFQTSTAGASGTTLQTLAPRIQINNSGILAYNGVMPTSGSGGTDSAIFRNSSTGQYYLAPGSAVITADNGLTKSTATNVQLGATASGSANSPLLHDTYINTTSSYQLIIYGEAASDEALTVNNFSGGKGLSVVTTGTQSIYAQSNTSNAFYGVLTPSSQNSVVEILKLSRETTGGGGAGQVGIGASIGMYLQTSTTAGQLSNQFVSEYTTVTHGSQTSKLTINGVLGGATVDLITLAGDGSVKLRGITATAASAITAANGMIVYVTDTDATFTSVGFWGREAGAWVKL